MREKATGSEDIAFLHSATEDGQGTRILRLRKGKVEAAEVRPVKEGQTINTQEVVRLHPRETTPRVCDVEVLHAPLVEEPEASEQSGPARVSSKAYRENWDRIFTSDATDKKKGPGDDWEIN
jgi:hypothetical protein